MALATGFSVANCYYNQSLLGSIVSDFHASEYDGSIISALTQFGYVVGLCIVIPLGNTLSKKRIITIDYFCCSMALLSVAITKDLFIIKLSSFIIGISSVMPQFFIPMAALYSEPKRLNFRQQEPTHIMENVLYNHLRVIGYLVDVGIVESREMKAGKMSYSQREIDFIANKGSRKYYIQSAYSIPSEEKW